MIGSWILRNDLNNSVLVIRMVGSRILGDDLNNSVLDIQMIGSRFEFWEMTLAIRF